MPGLDLNAILTGGASAVVVLVVMLALIIRGQLVPGWAYTELKERNRNLEEAARLALEVTAARREASGAARG